MQKKRTDHCPVNNRTDLFPFGSITFYAIALTLISLLASCAAGSPVAAPTDERVEAPTAAETPAPSPQVAPATQPTEPAMPTGEETSEPIGIITFAGGDVFIDEATGKRVSGMMRLLVQLGRTPSALEVLRNGTRLRVEAGGSVTVVCYNNRVLRITQQRVVQMTTTVCGTEGRQLPAKSVASVRPDNGTIATAQGSRRLSPESREKEGDYGKIPIIVAPRNTKILDAEPIIQWVEVPGVPRYKLTLNGPVLLPDQIVTREDITCEDTGIDRIGAVCSLAWPLEEWPLVTGEVYFLAIHARVGIEWNASEPSAIETLFTEEADRVQADVNAIQTLELDSATENLLLAGLFAQEKLYDAAIRAYQARLDEAPAALVAVTLGDVYRATDLQMFAFFAYQAALDLLDASGDDPAVRAAAAFGQGQVEYSFLNYANAVPHFEQAVRLAQASGQDVLHQAAQAALDAAHERIVNPSSP